MARSPGATASPATWPRRRTTSRCTSSPRATAPHHGGTAGRRCGTATSRPSTAGSTARIGRPRPTWRRSSDAPDGAETAAAPVDAPGGARPGGGRADRDAAAHAPGVADRRSRGVAAPPRATPGPARALGRDRLARAGERVPNGALRALARLRVRRPHADAPVPARALPPRRRVPVGVPPGGDTGARVAGRGRGSGTGRVPRPSAAGVPPARRPGDSFLLMHALVNWYAREPRIVLAAALQWDPAIDVVLNRLPNRFLSTGGPAVEQQIGALATALDDDDAFVIFPEGGNFTERRRAAGIARLRARGLEEAARRSEAMRHVLPPQPGGVAAALTAAPEADVVWVAHAGLDHLFTVADVWRRCCSTRSSDAVVAGSGRRGTTRVRGTGAVALRMVGTDRRGSTRRGRAADALSRDGGALLEERDADLAPHLVHQLQGRHRRGERAQRCSGPPAAIRRAASTAVTNRPSCPIAGSVSGSSTSCPPRSASDRREEERPSVTSVARPGDHGRFGCPP